MANGNSQPRIVFRRFSSHPYNVAQGQTDPAARLRSATRALKFATLIRMRDIAS
jgi:hypothetical protein